MLDTTLIIVHSLCWAVWFGVGLNAPGDIRHILPLDRPHQEELLGRLDTLMGIWIPAANATLWSGVVLVLLKFGWRDVPPGMYLKLSLTVSTFIVGIFLLKPTLKAFGRAIAAGDRDVVEATGTRFGRLVLLEKTIILTVVVLTLVGRAVFGPAGTQVASW